MACRRLLRPLDQRIIRLPTAIVAGPYITTGPHSVFQLHAGEGQILSKESMKELLFSSLAKFKAKACLPYLLCFKIVKIATYLVCQNDLSCYFDDSTTK